MRKFCVGGVGVVRSKRQNPIGTVFFLIFWSQIGSMGRWEKPIINGQNLTLYVDTLIIFLWIDKTSSLWISSLPNPSSHLYSYAIIPFQEKSDVDSNLTDWRSFWEKYFKELESATSNLSPVLGNSLSSWVFTWWVQRPTLSFPFLSLSSTIVRTASDYRKLHIGGGWEVSQ